MAEMFFGAFVAIICVCIGFLFGYLSKSPDSTQVVKDILKTKTDPFIKKERKTPVVNDDRAAWAMENKKI